MLIDERHHDHESAPPEATVGSRAERVAVVAAALLAAVVWVVIAASHGALGVARNDDWTYIRIATHFAHTGEFQLDGWVHANFIGQALAATPVVAVFGDGIVPLQLLVAAFGTVGLIALYWVIRQWLDWRWTALVVACLALGPVYGIIAVSFMTDVPGLALQMLTLLAGVRALRAVPVHRGWLVVALVLGLAAFSIREFGAASGAAVAVYALARAGANRERFASTGAIIATWLVAMAALYFWRTSLPNTWPSTIELSPSAFRSAASSVWKSFLTLGLFVSPVALAVSPVKLWNKLRREMPRSALVVLALFIAIAALVAFTKGLGFIGNHLDRVVAYSGTVSGDPVRVLSEPVWVIVLLVALASSAVLLMVGCLRLRALIRNRRAWRASLATSDDRGANLCLLFVVVYSAGLVAALALTTTELFDRYVLVAGPLIAALMVRAAQAEEVMRALPGRREVVSLAGFITLGLVVVDASATFDGAKWKIGEAVEQMTGWEAGSIDAGYEWYGYHQTGNRQLQPRLTAPNFWRALFEPRPVCATVSYAPEDPAQVPTGDIIVSLERSTLFGIDVHLVAEKGPDECPTPR